MKKRRRGLFGCFFSLIKLFLLIGTLLLIYIGYGIYKNIKRVEVYRSQVENLTKEYQIDGYETLALAIIYTESKGQGIDLMQSSESLTGEQALIDSQGESLNQGVRYLSAAIDRSKQAACDIATAVQAYNFGLDYIDFVEMNGGETTIELAETYSKEIVAPSLGNNSETTYRYWRLPALFYNGGHLYNDGGNFFYAEIVKTNQMLIESYEKIFE